MDKYANLDSLPRIIKSIPRHCLRPSMARSFAYLARDLVLAGILIAAIVTVHNPWLALPLSILLGTVLTGLFVIGHDAGHRSFSTSLTVNNIVGEILSAITIWPFHVWRLSHDTHHRYTHHLDKEVAWRPFTQAKIDRLTPKGRFMYFWTRSWGYVVGSIFFTAYFVRDGLRGLKSRHFQPGDLASIYRSVIFTAIVTAVMIATIWHVAGFYGLIFLFLIPQLTFQMYMSTFTFFHHTHPESFFMEEGTWNPAKAQLGSTIHLKYPAWVEWLTHDISWHVPHHVCVGIPHYHLREAHAALKASYPEIVREEVLTPSYIVNVISACQVAGKRGQGYISWEKYRTPAPVNFSETAEQS